VTLAELHIAPHYARGILLYGARFFPDPVWAADLEPGGPNAEAALIGATPRFRWRVDYPSLALDEPLYSNEIRRTAAHEIGHPFELLCVLMGIDIHRLYFEFRGFTGTWAEWAAEPWKQVREGFADCFGAALLGEWLVPVGSSQADRFFNEGRTVTAAAARDFFLRITGATVPVVPDCAFAEWLPSPNFTVGGNSMTFINDHWTVTPTFESALRTLTDGTTGPARVSSHYLVGRDGRIGQLVRERDQAWANAMLGWNPKAISIEHVHMPGEDWPATQLEASARLHRDIERRRGIALSRAFVLGHNQTGYNTACPGDLPIDRLLEEYLNMGEITETRLRQIIREESTTPIETKLNAGFGIGLNHKLRRLARWIKLTGTAGARDPGGVGGTDTTGYQDDNTPLA
jgi:hypothetical protein